MKKILVSFDANGQNGGPYISHKRIMNSSLKNKYLFEPFFYPRIRKLINPFNFFSNVKRLKKTNADAMLVAGLQWTGFLLVLLCKFSGLKIILAVHGSLTENKCSKLKKIIYGIIEKSTVRMSDFVYGVSDYVSGWNICKKCSHYYGTIYNMYEKENRACVDWRKRLQIKDNDIVVVSTGRITVDKGFDILWETIKKLGHLSNVKYIIAGDGPYLKKFWSEVKQNKFENEVFLVGFQRNIDSILQNADIFVICTKHETLCISLLEAAMHKLPLVATNVGGIPEIIDDSCGIIVPLNDVNCFANALERLKQDVSLRKKMGHNAYDKVSRKFDQEKIIKKLDRIFSEV